ncbi:MAG: HelD family protein [Acutalibacteraceae bacterium]
MKKVEQAELDYLKKVRDFIDREIESLDNMRQELEDKIISEGKKFAMDDPYLSVYGGTALTDLQYSIERKISRCENAKSEAYYLKKIKSHPYFARVDFKEEGYDADKFYIGLKSLFDDKESEPYVYDWRAPVAALFYEDFDDSAAWYDAPSGRIEGEILKKRQYKFENGEIVYCFDNTLKIDDYVLQQALSEGSTDRLKVIVSSIQKEQNKAIRFGSDKNLIISGPAGSGKTSVGFHRIAYLLYRNRNSLSSAEIVMFTGSDIFASYVSDIIPELGEAPIADFNFYSLTDKIEGDYKILDYYHSAESVINNEPDARRFAEVKYSDSFIKFLTGYIKKLPIEFSDFCLYGDTVYTGRSMSEHLKKRIKHSTFAEQVESLSIEANEKIEQYFSENYQKIYEIADAQSSILDDTGEYIESMKKEIKQRAKAQLETELAADNTKMLLGAYEQFETKNKDASGIAADFKEKLRDKILTFEDSMLILYIRCLLGRVEQKSDVRHVLIDEAQDFSPLQHQIIRFIYPKANFTVLTDSNQAIAPSLNTTDINTLESIYSAETLTLHKSYRSTVQISSFAKNLLQTADYEVFDRNGNEPEIIETEDIYPLIKSELETDEESVCIITKTTAQAREIYNRLIETDDVELYDDKSKIFSGKAAVMPLVYTKGLEFDKVIIYDGGDEFFGEENKPYLYMAATRALHTLKIIKKKSETL